MRWVDSFQAAIDWLVSYPRRGKRVLERKQFDDEVRQNTHGNYRIVYSVGEGEVWVLHVRHTSRRAIGE